MKHTLKITLILVFLFFMSQIAGLAVTGSYIDRKATQEKGEAIFIDLPYNIERPPVEQKSSFVFIIAAILAGTALVLLLIRFRKAFLWKLWFFLAVFLCLAISFSAFINSIIALVLSLVLAGIKIFKPNIIVHNIIEVFIYGGLAAIFVPIMNMFAVVALMLLISVYDFIAVFKLKHMITLAKFQAKSKVFAGLFIPYKKEKIGKGYAKKEIKAEKGIRTAILGGGDIGFPLLFAGVVMKGLVLNNLLAGLLKSLIIPAFATIALFLLLVKGKKDKFYPAMPFLTIGCFVGFFVVWVIGLL